MATGGHVPGLSFEDICTAARSAATSRVLPTAILVGHLEDEVRVLSYVVRCRPSGFMVILPALDLVQDLLRETCIDADGNSLVVHQEASLQLEDSRG